MICLVIWFRIQEKLNGGKKAIIDIANMLRQHFDARMIPENA